MGAGVAFVVALVFVVAVLVIAPLAGHRLELPLLLFAPVGPIVAPMVAYWLTPHAVAAHSWRDALGASLVVAFVTTVMGAIAAAVFIGILTFLVPTGGVHITLATAVAWTFLNTGFGLFYLGIPAFVLLIIPSLVWAALVRRVLRPGSIGA